MSEISRNVPCPCGSGRKYKRCCLPLDAARERNLTLVPREFRGLTDGGGDGDRSTRASADDTDELDIPNSGASARSIATWLVDLMPIPGSLDADHKTRSALGLVVSSDDVVIAGEPIVSAPSELDAITDVIEDLLERGAASVGAWPSMVRVRQPQIRALLAPRLSHHGTTVRTARKLPALDRARRAFAQQVLGIDEPALLGSFIGNWSQWGAPVSLVADVLAASAEYWKAKPWDLLSDADQFRVIIPGQASWNAVVMGQAGQTFGIALYEQYSDVERMNEATGDTGGLRAIQGMGLALTFDHRRDVPRDFRDDVKRNRWVLPAPDVYPVLVTTNTPAGGVTRAQLHEIALILRAMAAFTAALPGLLADENAAGFWKHPETGVNVVFSAGEMAVAMEAVETSVLAPSGPEGPRAEPSARIDVNALDDETRKEMDVVSRFGKWCRTNAGVTEGSRDTPNAELFINFLAHDRAIPVRAVTECDLRVFLHDWVHRKVRLSDEQAAEIPESVGRFFTYLAAREGIVCPWAAPLLEAGAIYRHRRSTFPGGFWWDPGVAEWREEVFVSLAARVLVPDFSDPDGVGGAPTMGVVEATLVPQLERLWLVWRDELIRSGLTDRDAVVDALVERQARWEQTPNALAQGATPRNAIAEERRALANRGRSV